MTTWDLAELKHHYGEAYLITRPAVRTWLAQKRNDQTVLRADDPDELLLLIREEQRVRPVPRD